MINSLFLRRFIERPMQVASIVPSSRTLIRKVSEKMDHSGPRVIAEFGPGEGCHTREILARMHPQSRLILFELDDMLAAHLKQEFAGDARVFVYHGDASDLPQVLATLELPYCDYVVSGIPFSILEKETKRRLLRLVHDTLNPEYRSAFVIYQVTNELVNHCRHFGKVESEYCLRNIPPMFVTKFYRSQKAPAASASNGNGSGHAAEVDGSRLSEVSATAA